jgi:hypothetical protein
VKDHVAEGAQARGWPIVVFVRREILGHGENLLVEPGQIVLMDWAGVGGWRYCAVAGVMMMSARAASENRFISS